MIWNAYGLRAQTISVVRSIEEELIRRLVIIAPRARFHDFPVWKLFETNTKNNFSGKTTRGNCEPHGKLLKKRMS